MRGADTFAESLFTLRQLEDLCQGTILCGPSARWSTSFGEDGSDETGGGSSFKGQTRSNQTHESKTHADAPAIP